MTDLMHAGHTAELHERLTDVAVAATVAEIDNAIQWVVESITEEDGIRPNLTNEMVWFEVQHRVLTHLGLDPDTLTGD